MAKGRFALRIWAWSVGFWTLAALVLGSMNYLAMPPGTKSSSLADSLGMHACEFLTFAVLTPFVYVVAARRSFDTTRRGAWALTHGAGAIVFALLYVALFGLTPYAEWNGQANAWESGVTWGGAGGIQVHWDVLRRLLLQGGAEVVLFVYTPVVLIAQAVSYHERVRDAERRRAQLEAQLTLARLEALKRQLQPHFLFNTLHSISSLMMSDTAAADRMMTLLSDLLRMSLSDDSPFATFGEELDFARTYLEIEKIRYEERLRLSLDVAPEALGAVVPRLLLQPLVENAVRHGIAKLADGGRLHIGARRERGELLVEITNDAPGEIDRRREASRGGLGLTSTRERLASLYAGDASLELANTRAGVALRLRIPWQTRLSLAEEEPLSPRSASVHAEGVA